MKEEDMRRTSIDNFFKVFALKKKKKERESNSWNAVWYPQTGFED